MTLNLGKIFKQAWDITKANRFLWLYGLFLLWGNLVNVSLSVRENEIDRQKFYSSDAVIWLQANPEVSFWIFFLIVLILAALAYLFFRIRAGSIVAIKELIDKKPTSFNQSFQQGRLHYRKIIYSYIMTSLGTGLISLVVVLPISYLASQIDNWQMVILALLGLSIWLPCVIVAGWVGTLAPLFAVMLGMNAWDSIRASFSMISMHWRQLIVFGILMVGLMIAVFVFTMLMLSPFVVLGVLAYHNVSGPANMILSSVLIGLGILGFLFVQSLAAVFQQSSWILAFIDLAKPEKTDQESVAAVAEIAS